MSTKNSKSNGQGVFTMDGTDYGSKSGGPQPLAGLTGLSSGTDFQLTGDAMNPGIQSSTGTISPVAGDMYKQIYGTDPYLVGSGDYAFNVDGVKTGNMIQPSGTQGTGNFGFGSPMDASAMGQGSQPHQTGSGKVRLQAENFTPGMMASLTGGSTQGNNLIALLQKMKAGSAV